MLLGDYCRSRSHFPVTVRVLMYNDFEIVVNQQDLTPVVMPEGEVV